MNPYLEQKQKERAEGLRARLEAAQAARAKSDRFLFASCVLLLAFAVWWYSTGHRQIEARDLPEILDRVDETTEQRLDELEKRIQELEAK